MNEFIKIQDFIMRVSTITSIEKGDILKYTTKPKSVIRIEYDGKIKDFQFNSKKERDEIYLNICQNLPILSIPTISEVSIETDTDRISKKSKLNETPEVEKVVPVEEVPEKNANKNDQPTLFNSINPPDTPDTSTTVETVEKVDEFIRLGNEIIARGGVDYLGRGAMGSDCIGWRQWVLDSITRHRCPYR